MNETMSHVAAAIKKELDKSGLGAFNVSVRTTGAASRAWDSGDKEAEKYDLTLLIQNDGAETDPVTYKAHIAQALEKIAPLAAYAEFKLPEPEPDHFARLSGTFDTIRSKAMAAGLAIPEAYGDWFKERTKLAKLNETTSEIRPIFDHAVTTMRNDNFITASFVVPTGVNAEDAEKAVAGRIDAFKSLLARMAAKKLSPDVAEQAGFIQKIKALDVVVTSQSFGSGSTINVEIRSPQVAEAMKKPGGLAALSADEIKALKDSNPLMSLKDGDGLTKETPADLQKTLARAILFEGENGEKPIPLFSKIAGPLDIKAAIEKSLKFIKHHKPELAADVDEVLKDKLFEDRSRWGRHATKNADGTLKKEPIEISKRDKSNYVAGQFSVNLSVPGDKVPELLGQLAALDSPAAEQQQAPVVADTPATAPQDKDWASKFAKQTEANLSKNDPAVTARERLVQAATPGQTVGAAR